MALHLLGTKAAVQLGCLAGWSQVLIPADVGALSSAIVSDELFAKNIMGVTSPAWVLATATTAGTPTLTAVTARAGSPAITNIMPRDLVLGSAADITPGTFVVSIAGTTVTLSQPAASSGTLKGVSFLRSRAHPFGIGTGTLTVPGRGTLQILPGDVIAVDSCGWPILLSANTISFAGSDWTFT